MIFAVFLLYFLTVRLLLYCLIVEFDEQGFVVFVPARDFKLRDIFYLGGLERF